MPQLIAPQEITLHALKQTLDWQYATSLQFFSEWSQYLLTIGDCEALAYMLENQFGNRRGEAFRRSSSSLSSIPKTSSISYRIRINIIPTILS